MIRYQCPVCSSKATRVVWQIPFAPLRNPVAIHGATIKDYPTLDPDAEITTWERCQYCQSVFLNPLRAELGSDDHYIKKMANPQEWAGYRRRWAAIRQELGDLRGPIVDAACAVGQYGVLAAIDGFGPILAMEQNATYVAHMRKTNPYWDLYQAVLPAIPQQCLDGWRKKAVCLVFSEAFEHMLDARAVVTALAELLAPGGLMFFSAQCVEGGLPIRPGETIYVTRLGIQRCLRDAGLSLSKIELHSGRFWVWARKP